MVCFPLISSFRVKILKCCNVSSQTTCFSSFISLLSLQGIFFRSIVSFLQFINKSRIEYSKFYSSVDLYKVVMKLATLFSTLFIKNPQYRTCFFQSTHQDNIFFIELPTRICHILKQKFSILRCEFFKNSQMDYIWTQ